MRVELAAVIAIINFMMGYTLFGYRKAIKCAMSLMAIGSLLGLWILLACISPPHCTAVTYHPVIHQVMADGTVSDVIEVVDESGEVKIVNVNSSLGVSVPPGSERTYQVARVQYDKNVLGLLLGFRGARYQLVPANN